jgi:mannose-1-phosphate guanylyltransferase
MNLVPVLLAGGIGERFWPLSRTRRPKQLLPLVGRKSMIETTLRRVAPLCRPGVPPVIVTGRAIARAIRRQLRKRISCTMLVEPQGKDTAPAVALAAAYVEKRYGPSVMAVLPADHAISPAPEFHRAARLAAQIAQERDRLIVFGIPPSRPDTGYGYVELGEQFDERDGITVYDAHRFVEKPSWEKAVEYRESGRYLWNSGMFVWRTSVVLEEFKRYMPRLHAQVRRAATGGFTREALARYYRACEKKSIDYGIMERSRRVAVVSAHFLWDDVGSWEAVGRIRPGNERHTTVVGGKVFEQACTNSIVLNDSSTALAVFGADNIVVVATEDAVLVTPRSELPNLKSRLAAMKKDGRFPARLF